MPDRKAVEDVEEVVDALISTVAYTIAGITFHWPDEEPDPGTAVLGRLTCALIQMIAVQLGVEHSRTLCEMALRAYEEQLVSEAMEESEGSTTH